MGNIAGALESPPRLARLPRPSYSDAIYLLNWRSDAFITRLDWSRPPGGKRATFRSARSPVGRKLGRGEAAVAFWEGDGSQA